MKNYRESPDICASCTSYNCGSCSLVKGSIDPGGTCDKFDRRDDSPKAGEFYLKEYEKVKDASSSV